MPDMDLDAIRERDAAWARRNSEYSECTHDGLPVACDTPFKDRHYLLALLAEREREHEEDEGVINIWRRREYRLRAAAQAVVAQAKLEEDDQYADGSPSLRSRIRHLGAALEYRDDP